MLKQLHSASLLGRFEHRPRQLPGGCLRETGLCFGKLPGTIEWIVVERNPSWSMEGASRLRPRLRASQTGEEKDDHPGALSSLQLHENLSRGENVPQPLRRMKLLYIITDSRKQLPPHKTGERR
jgi:hypothetical protein